METSRFEQYARVAAVALLVFGCFLIIQPFLGAILFAGVLCMSTWPAYTFLRKRWGGRSSLAALALVLLMVVGLALPVALAAQSLIVHAPALVEVVRGIIEQRTAPQLPDFIVNLPLVGASLNEYWQVLLQSRDELFALARKLADPAKAMLVGMGGAVGQGLVQIRSPSSSRSSSTGTANASA
jgi:predicted PurR-regulated permease PerM